MTFDSKVKTFDSKVKVKILKNLSIWPVVQTFFDASG